MKTGETVIVSACLLGLKSRYDGTDSKNEWLMASLAGATVIPVCPEQLGGLPTPRPAAGISGGNGHDVLDKKARVMDERGTDVTGHFLKGADETLRIAHITGAKRALLKEGSPSCGVTLVTRDGVAAAGPGVTAALLRREGIDIQGVE